MKRALALLAIFLVFFTVVLPGTASAAGRWQGGGGHGSSHMAHSGWHGGHGHSFHGHGGHGGCCWWWPGAFVGGLALGAVALATAPLWAFTPPPPAPEVVQAPAPVYSQSVYAQPAYSAPATLPVPPPGSAPVAYAPTPAAIYQPAQSSAPSQAPAVQREVIHDTGRYVLYGDGVRQPWQWVWVPAAAPPPPPPPPR
jgi:hypothetical protein